MALFSRQPSPEPREPTVYVTQETSLLSDVPNNISRYSPTFFSESSNPAVAYITLNTPSDNVLDLVSRKSTTAYFENPTRESFGDNLERLSYFDVLARTKELAVYTYTDEVDRGVRRFTDAHKALNDRVNKVPESPNKDSLPIVQVAKSGALKKTPDVIGAIGIEYSITPPELAAETSRIRIGLEIIKSDVIAQHALGALRAFSRQAPQLLARDEKVRLDTRLTLLDQSRNAKNKKILSEPESPLSYVRGVDQRLAVIAATLDTLTKMPPLSGQDDLNGYLQQAQELASYARTLRTPFQLKLLNDNGVIEALPANSELYNNPSLSLLNPPREEINLRTPAELAADAERRRKEKLTEVATQREREAAERQSLLEEETPLVETANGIVDRHSELLAPFRNQTSRHLRSEGLLGPNSVDYSLRQSKLEAPQGFESYIRVYDGLSQFVDSHEEYVEDFDQLTEEEKQLRAAYLDILNGRIFKSGARPNTLGADLSEDLDWLRKNWTEFTSYISRSEHKNHMSQETLSRIKVLLYGVETEIVEEPQGQEEIEVVEEIEIEQITEEVTEDVEIETPTEPIKVVWTEEELLELAEMEREERERVSISREELIKANELAEQLDWVVLPDQKITPEELENIARRTLSANGRSAQTIDRERMVNLLRFRDTYGGTLYRSAERMLGDSNNLYFVLKFTHPGDDNTYAIAENVVYGNATYVLREDILPLMEGETVLTAVKLPRKVVRDLGAKRLLHVQNPRMTHPERITNSLVELSNASV